ncbi:MAG: hypothetical protein K6B67_09335 [Lachnospiraceae bacterium]|nr:hypothetical protein [Lachnospiraceae bacterium]
MKEERFFFEKPLKDWNFTCLGKTEFQLDWGNPLNGIVYKWEYEEDENQSGTNFYLRKSFNMMYKYIIVGFLDALAILILLLCLVTGGGYLLLMFLGFAIIPFLLTYMAYLQFGKHAERVLRDFLDAI